MANSAYQPLLSEKDEHERDTYEKEVDVGIADVEDLPLPRRRSGRSEIARSLLTSLALIAFIIALITYGNSKLPRRRPSRPSHHGEPSNTIIRPGPGEELMARPLNNYNLRILPIGDSITEGAQSGTHDGYRAPLYDLLAGNSVEMVGSQRSGTMRQNAHEGHANYRMDQIQNYADEAAIFDPNHLPNLVLVHAGTADMTSNYALSTAPLRLSFLLTDLLTAYPNAVILVAQLIPSRFPTFQERIADFNLEIPQLIRERFDTKPVYVVDMGHVLSPSMDLADTTHPNDDGYAKMALAWLQAIEQVEGMGWLNNITDGSLGGYSVPSMAVPAPPITTTVAASLSGNGTFRHR